MNQVKYLTVLSKYIDRLPVVNGQIIFCTDTQELYFDNNNVRKSTSSFIFRPTDEDIKSIAVPMPGKLYISKKTNKLWQYVDGQWVLLADNSNAVTDITFNGSSDGITKTGQLVNIDNLWDEF